MRYSVSDTAEYGDYTRGPRIVNEQTRAEMKKILCGDSVRRIRASDWIGREQEPAARSSWPCAKGQENQPIEKVGAELRKMMTVPEKEKGSRRTGRYVDSICAVFTFDTTLRDGTQGEAVSFSADDKILVAHKLDELGIDYIEGGWPGSNPKDKEFLRPRQATCKLKHARLVAFGATRFARNTVEEGRQRQRADRGRNAGGVDFRQELGSARRIARSASPKKKTSNSSPTPCAYLKAHGKEVVYDAEHFFDGYNAQSRFRAAHSRSREESRRRCSGACAIPTAARMTHAARGNLRRRAQELRRHAGHSHP